MPSVTDCRYGSRAAQAMAKPSASIDRFSTSAKGARVLKLATSSAQFLTTASSTMSTNSTVAMRVARGSKRSAQAGRWRRAHMPRATGTPSTSATWPIISPTGTFTAREAPRKCVSDQVTTSGSVKMVSTLATAVKLSASATSPRAR